MSCRKQCPFSTDPPQEAITRADETAKADLPSLVTKITINSRFNVIMSTSISITLSDDQDSKTSRSFSDLRKLNTSNELMFKSNDIRKDGEFYERRHTGLGFGSLREPTSIILGTGKLKRWDETNNERRDGNNKQGEFDDDLKSDGFYLEVDEKMSKNSYEYPEQQAKYIENWLDTSNTPYRSKSFGDESLQLNGNVVGIRGFSDDKSLIGQIRSDNNQNRVCGRCKRIQAADGIDEELEKMRFAKNQSSLKLLEQEQAHAAILSGLSKETERLKLIIQERDDELVSLKNQVKNLTLEPGNRKLLALSSENARLKESEDIEKQEHFALKENYSRLEQKLRSLIADQTSINNEQRDEIKEVLLELCKLQVYLPKLEMILDTETQIKLHLQSQLTSRQEENEKLNDQIVSLRRELNKTWLQVRSKESCDVERFRNDLLVWQDKYDRLKREYSDLNELLRSSKSSLAHQDVRLQNELHKVRQSCQLELDQAIADRRKSETKIASLEVDLSRVTNQLDRCKSERDRSNQELLQLHQKLEEVSSSRPDEQSHIKLITNKLRQCEQTNSTLLQELSNSSLNNKDLTTKIEMAHSRLEQSKQQYNELKRRFEIQQKLFEELKEKRDREVAKLRLDLNLEQYNRQVSLKGIEKELRSSLRELEAMKYRFSKRLSIPGDSFATINTTTAASSSETPPGSACKRTVRFNGP